MDILHVVNIPFVIPFFLGEQLVHFSKKGYAEHIICSFSDELELFAERYGFKYESVDIPRKISLMSDLRAIRKVCSYIRKNDISCVTGHTPKGAMIAMISGWLMRTSKRIYFRHGLVYETSNGLKRFVLKSVDRLTALLATKIVNVSPSVAKRAVADKLNSAEKQILLSKGTCNGIDTKRFAKKSDIDDVLALKKRYGLDKYNFVVGFTGRLVKDKGIVELIEAYRRICTVRGDIALLLVGMFETRDALPENIIYEIESIPSIIQTGYVDNSLIEKYYSLMDIFVLPSYREGFPTSVLEASSMQIPVITTPATGCIDSIVDGETGLFVNHSPDSLFEAIIRLIDDASMRENLGKNGRKFVVDNFQQEVIWDAIEKSLYS